MQKTLQQSYKTELKIQPYPNRATGAPLLG